jgi:predicted neuraminidase/peroxiredoxin
MFTLIGLAIGALSMETLDGLTVEMDNYDERRGTVVLFLSSRCPVTHETISAINDTYERTRTREVLFVGLVVNPDETAAELQDFCQKNAVRFPIYRDPEGKIANKLGIKQTPQGVLLDEQGVVLYQGGFSPAAASDDFGRAVKELLAKKPQSTTSFASQGTPLNQSGAPIPSDDPFGVLQFSSELIFDAIPGAPVHHCSTLAEAPNGDLLCVWYGGSYESADDQVLFVSRQKSGARDWSAPAVLEDGDHLQPPGNAVVFRASDKRIGLLWGRMEGSRPVRRGRGWGECRLMYRYSEDNGYTWSKDRELEGLLGCLPRNAPLVLQDGRVAVPLSGHMSDKNGGFMLMTRDGGDTWETSGVIEGGSQPTIIQRKDGSLLALLRSEPWILRSESTDLGKSWTPVVKTDLRCPGSAIAMTQLQNGHLLLAFNNSPNSDRTPFNLIRSTDEGKTWEDLRTFEANWGEYSYPCLIQDSAGRMHLTYTFRRYSIKHIEFNEDWVSRLLRPN